MPNFLLLCLKNNFCLFTIIQGRIRTRLMKIDIYFVPYLFEELSNNLTIFTRIQYCTKKAYKFLKFKWFYLKTGFDNGRKTAEFASIHGAASTEHSYVLHRSKLTVTKFGYLWLSSRCCWIYVDISLVYCTCLFICHVASTKS